MAKGKFISEFERDVIRIGVDRGIAQAHIARFLGRCPAAVHAQVKKMRDSGTLENVPLEFVADEIALAIRARAAA